jgi:hypothetical protein
LKNLEYARLLDGDKKPSERSILATIGTRSTKLWNHLRTFLKVNYDFKPELLFYGKKYGWCIKYARKKKTLCVLFPETKAFTVLVVLGKKEVAHFVKERSRYNEDTRRLFDTAYQYHDGRWLYKRVLIKSDLTDVLALIELKKAIKQ